ncbi:hypothetical protein LBMAG40_15700 [Cyanobium sp.]|nr:hypothetical protein LBMAG40_15700 [Cyanobium sp.]
MGTCAWAPSPGVLATSVGSFDPTASLCLNGICRSHERKRTIVYRDRDDLNELGVLMLDGDLRRLLQRD